MESEVSEITHQFLLFISNDCLRVLVNNRHRLGFMKTFML